MLVSVTSNFNIMDSSTPKERQEELFSKSVKAGKRTYFFDVKATKGNDLYITLTESKKVFSNGEEQFQKHKIFLYKEDFEKVLEGLQETIEKVKELQNKSVETNSNNSISDISFEDL